LLAALNEAPTRTRGFGKVTGLSGSAPAGIEGVPDIAELVWPGPAALVARTTTL
jgi:hypothetical protein